MLSLSFGLMYNVNKEPQGQWVDRWPADLVVAGARLDGGGNLSTRRLGFIAHRLLLSPHHCPDISVILLARRVVGWCDGAW